MTLYAIFDPKPGRRDLPAVVPEKFSGFAALLPPLFLLRHGLWLELVAWLVSVVALMVLSGYIGDAATFALYLLTAIWLGFAAPGLRRHALQWRGWSPRGDRVAASADLAQLEALR
ncbi:DUF2628 domain-containing protein [Devosia sp. SL43]|uniref:DUF2628 domain-containing protein n=1 Tax=Devosia sp. SL43 TaxID=2806348 RepID=UPI001F1D224F|nr:DUF2628 domain-containing protein [Devosia sp. SL43]UJW84345.1 DUF2628 domain-containing protein [Devosia sp. SL43]